VSFASLACPSRQRRTVVLVIVTLNVLRLVVLGCDDLDQAGDPKSQRSSLPQCSWSVIGVIAALT
jgi:hypothetical protein